uniref:Potassium/proton antiporter CemA n=1 Tax=Parietochloris pseudoalveolaris TaxID=3102 RepID=A0A097KLL7_9CHLO|nr:chloroplast enveloppe membrane protein [Parietochloris pseudoalveolaris]AIT94079.1 chloroplast enveloppe membrane protein [Parietochloris pseudoalveolaris]
MAVEKTSLIPRSILRTFERFRQQLVPESEKIVIQEFLISRYQVLVSVRCLLSLICLPLLVNYLTKNFLLTPLTEYFWNTHQNEIFLNSYQQNRAFIQMQDFEEKLYFESLIDFCSNCRENKFPEESCFPGPRWPGLANKALLTNLPSERPTTHAFWLTKEAEQQTYVMFQNNNKNNITVSAVSPETTNFSFGKYKFPEASKSQGPLKDSHLSSYPKRVWLVKPKGSLNLQNNNLKLMSNISTNFVSDKINTNVLAKASNSSESFSINEQLVTKTSNCGFFDNKNYLVEKFQQKTLQLAFDYNQQSIQAITHVLGDLITFITINLLVIWMKPQIIILKSFLAESIYSLSDTTKSFLLILLTDLLVGFHSPKGWEVFIEVLLRHFGFPENQNFIFLFVGTFPVFLDTVFKYWIFRQLNKISPSTVATYHNMIE